VFARCSLLLDRGYAFSVTHFAIILSVRSQKRSRGDRPRQMLGTTKTLCHLERLVGYEYYYSLHKMWQ
jgi:hypothetical protein